MSSFPRYHSGRYVYAILALASTVYLKGFPSFNSIQSRKDVTITYTRKPQTDDTSVQFDDVVEYRSKSDSASSKRSSIVGVDTLLTPHKPSRPEVSQEAPAAAAQTRYKWRGKGLLMIASSRWQVLGCSRDPSPGNTVAWAVTYFEKTLFTPPGLDIYARTAEGLPDGLVEEIIAKVKALGGDVGLLAKTFFEVERSGVEPSKGLSEVHALPMNMSQLFE